MAVIFKAEGHIYTSKDPAEQIDWLGVTTLVSQFKEPFDADVQAPKSAKNPKSKWFGMDPEAIKAAWEAEAKRASTLGTFYHNQREVEITMFDTIHRDGVEVPIVRPLIDGEEKHAPDQRLVDGVYPEHFVYLKSAGVCGQSDRVEVVRGVVSISDYKTNKEIKMEGWKNWEGVPKKLSAPVSHLDDCHLNHYALQLSLYLYIILKHNPILKPGKLMIEHVTFEEIGKDQFGNPITYINPDDGNPVIKDIKQIEVPYLRNEVQNILTWLSNNRHKIRRK